MSGLHNASSNPTPSSLFLFLPLAFSLSLLLVLLFSLAHATIPRQARLLIVPGFPLNNNYFAILSAILYRKRKVGGRVKRTRRTRARWMAGRIKMERRGRIKFLITLQCQREKKCGELDSAVHPLAFPRDAKQDTNTVAFSFYRFLRLVEFKLSLLISLYFKNLF